MKLPCINQDGQTEYTEHKWEYENVSADGQTQFCRRCGLYRKRLRDAFDPKELVSGFYRLTFHNGATSTALVYGGDEPYYLTPGCRLQNNWGNVASATKLDI